MAGAAAEKEVAVHSHVESDSWLDRTAALQGKRVAILAADGVGQVELVEPSKAVEAVDGDTRP